MRRLVALGAALLITLSLAGTISCTALAQGLADVRLGNEAFRDGDFVAAVEHYTAAIRSGELVGEALAITYNNRGVAHGEAGDFGPAIADYSQALALRPDDATTIRNLRVAHVRRGEVSFASGAYDAARADFDRAIELEPDHYLAYQRRGELFAELGRTDEAVAELEQAAMLNPGDPEIVAALDAVSGRQGAKAGESPMPAETTETKTAAAPESSPEPAAPETPPETAAASKEPASAEPAPAVAAAPVEPASPEPAAAAEPEIAVRPEPAPREATPAASEPEPTEAPVVSAQPEPSQRESASESAPATASGSADDAAAGEPYRVISAVNYRAGPANEAQRLGTVDAGRIVQVTGDTLGWKHVILPNGDRGFIYKRWLEPAGN